MSLKELYKKVDDFQAKLSDESASFSQCKKGCSQCCKVELSIFRVEADSIRRWYALRSVPEKENLKELWKSEGSPGNCAFLIDDACSIYEARPLICRSQGLPFRFHEAGETYIDICPLNEDMLGSVGATEILNLDLLNVILSKIETAQGTGGERVSLRSLREELAR